MAENTINPLTGLPYTVHGADGKKPTRNPNVNPLTGKPYTVTNQNYTPFKGTIGIPGDYSDYDGSWSGLSPATNVNPFTNIDEQRARNQSTWDKWGNGIAKAGVTFVGAASENTVGYAMGLADYIASGFEDFDASMINNPVGQFFDKANDQMRESFPNFQTAQERAEQGTLGQLNNANFWSDTVLNGGAYSLGSIATMYLTGGVGLVTGGLKAAGVGARVSKGLASYRAAKALQNGKGIAEALKVGRKMRTGAARGSRALGYLEGGAMMSIAESAVEARETQEQVFEQMQHEFRLKNGLGIEDKIPEVTLNDMKIASSDMASAAFDANLAVLMPTNLFMFHGLLRPMQTGKNAIHGTGFVKEGGKKVLKDNLDALPGWAARAGKGIRSYVKPAITGAATETFQESSQYAITEGIKDYAAQQVSELGSVERFNAMRNGREAKGWLDGSRYQNTAIGKVFKDYEKNVSTPEGREQAMVGGIIGLLTGGFGGIKGKKAKDKLTRDAITTFANFGQDVKIQSLAKSVNNGEMYLSLMEAAEAANDTRAYEDAQFGLIREYALMHARNGTFDAFIERLEDSADLSKEDFDSLFGRESVINRGKDGRFNTVDKGNKDRVTELIERVQDLKSTYEMVEEMYPSKSPKGAILKGLTRALGGKERLKELKEQDSDQTIYKNKLVTDLTTSKNAYSRARKNLTELNKLDPELNVETILDIHNKNYADVFINPESNEEKITKNVEAQTKIQKALSESYSRAIANGHSAIKAQKLVASIYQTLTESNDALSAYNNLESSPEERDIFVAREKAKAALENQKRIDKQADDIIENTENVADLIKAKKQLVPVLEKGEKLEEGAEIVSPFALDKIEDEIVKRKAASRKEYLKFRAMNPDDVLKMDTSEMGAIEKEAWDRDVANIKSGKRKVASKPVVSQNTKDNTVDKANERKVNTKNNRKKDDVRSKYGKSKKNAKQDSQSRSNNIITRNPEGNQGEYQLIPNKDDTNSPFVAVDSEGNPVPGMFEASHRVNGEPIIKGRSRLADPEVMAGTEVTLSVIESDWWNNEATEEQKNDPVKNMPVYVKIGDDVVGVLASAQTSLREAAVNAYLKDGNAEAVTTTIKKKHANNFYTSATSNPLGMFQEFYFYNPVESLNNPIIGVVTLAQNGKKRYSVPEGTIDEGQITEDLESGPQNMTPGQVFFALKNPHGKYIAAAASTANLSESDQARALELIQEGSLEELDILVGTNVLYSVEGLNKGNSTKVLLGKQSGENVLYSFNAVDAYGKLDPNIPEGLLIRINDKLAKRVLNGEKITLDDLTAGVERNTLLVKPSVTIGEIAELTDETAATQENSIAAAYVADNLAQLLKNIVAAKKYQVSLEALTVEGGFVDANNNEIVAKDGVSGYVRYLTEGTQRPGGQGSKGILGTTTRILNGSAFIDIGLDLQAEGEIDGETTNTAEKPIIPAQNPEVKPAKTTTKKKKQVAPGQKNDTAPKSKTKVAPTERPQPSWGEDLDLTNQVDPETGNILNADNYELDPETGLLREITSAQPTSEVGLSENLYAVYPKAFALAREKGRINTSMLQENFGLTYAEAGKLIDVIDDKGYLAPYDGGKFRLFKGIPFSYLSYDQAVRIGGRRPTTLLNKAQAKAWLKERGIPVDFYDQAIRIGGGTVHGYMTQAGVNLWTQGEVGTEYHESFHYVFRTLLNKKQRDALYAEAKKNFKPSTAELKSLRKLNPELSSREIMELALEESMAEEFRDYVMTMEETAKTIPQRIRKFFKDLYSFIKSLFINPVGMKQLYSLIEANNLPKKYLRNTEKFGVEATAFAYNEDIVDSDFHKALQKTMVSFFVEGHRTKEEAIGRELSLTEFRQLIGHGKDKGQVAKTFLKNSFRYKDSKKALSLADLVKVRNKLDANEDLGALFAELGMEDQIPIDTGLPQSLNPDFNTLTPLEQQEQEELQENTAGWFRYMYTNWFDDVTTDGLDNIRKFGMRTIMIQGLSVHGYNVQFDTLDQKQANREDANDEQSQFDKIYNLSAMEQNPMDRASDETRRILAGIKAHEPNDLGLTTYVDLGALERLIIPAVANKNNLKEMLLGLKERVNVFPELAPVVEALEKTYSAQQQAAFYTTYALNYSELRIIEESYDNNVKTTKLINSNRKGAKNNAIDDWNHKGIQKTSSKPNAIFKLVDGKLTVNEEYEGQNRGELVTQAYLAMSNLNNAVEDRTRGFADVLHYMGLNLGPTVGESRLRLNDYLNTFSNPKAELISLIEKIQPSRIVNAAFTLNVDASTKAVIDSSAKTKVNKNPVNFFVAQSNRIKEIAEIKANFESSVAMSTVNGAGKVVWPYNLPTPMDAILHQMQNKQDTTDPSYREARDIVEMMAKDEFFNALDQAKYKSILMLLIKSGKFQITSHGLDVLKSEEDEVSKIDYENASARDSLIMRLEQYANGGNSSANYAVPTQETRGRMDFINMPRFTDQKEMIAAGIGNIKGAEAVIKGLIIQDLIRIARDERVIRAGKDLIKDYHDGRERYKAFQLTGVENLSIDGTRLSTLIARGVLDDTYKDDDYLEFHQAVDKMVKTYLNEHVKNKVKSLEDKINEYNLNQKGASRLPLAAINKLGGLNKFLTTYTINETVAKLEMAKVFRGGISLNKSVTDFYKRMGLFNTPGSKFFMQGDSKLDPNYGMVNEVNQGVIDEVRIVEGMHTEQAESYKAELIDQGISEEEAEEKVKGYRAGQAAAADGQAYGSPNLWRALREGEGLFTEEDAIWFDEYKKGGEWKAPYTASYKLYHESQKLVEFTTINENKKEQTEKQYISEMDKNSYIILTRDFVKGKPILTAMLDKMESENVHLINVVSAKKGAKQNVMPLDLSSPKTVFDNLVVTKQQGTDFYKPQTINDKKYDSVRLNRQIRKDALNLVNREAKYYLNRGIEGLETKGGISGEQMLADYHDAFETLLQIQMSELKTDLGYTQLLTAKAANDPKAMKEAGKEIFKKLRNLFLKENIKRDRLTDNIEKQLQLVYDNGVVDFALPIAFPAYQDKFQNLFLSVFKNRVLKTMMKGKEVVQVASIGGTIEDINGVSRELKFLSVETDKHGKKIGHAEVMVNAEIAKRFGLKPGDDLSKIPEELLRAVGYRIPHQDKSSTLIMKIVGILPMSYNKAIIVPGNITVMMGSDFDVDKIFVMFPEFTKASELSDDFVKVTLENYKSLKGSPGENLHKMALQNKMLDTIEAISSSPVHFNESITPLDTRRLEAIVKTLDKISFLDVEGEPFDSPLKDLEMEENYKNATKMVGKYSNALAGLSVASAGNKGNGVSIPSTAQFTIDGNTYHTVHGSPENFKVLVEHLSANLDAANKILGPQLNDTTQTVNSKIFLYSLGVDPLVVTLLHRTPMVMDFVKLITIDGLYPSKAFEKLGLYSSTQKLIKKNSEKEVAVSTPMTTSGLEDMITAERPKNGIYKGEELKVLKNFAISYFKGADLKEFFTAITPDTADSLSDLAPMQSLVELIEKFSKSDNMFGEASVKQFLREDSFKLSRSFFNAFQEILSLSSDLFLGATPAVKNFKDQFKSLTGKEFFTPDEHRVMDRALFYWMATKEGSPLNKLIAGDWAKNMVDPTKNTFTRLEEMREKHPEVKNNPFIMRLVAASSNESELNRVFNIQFENMQTMTPDLSNDMTRAFNEILTNDNVEIKQFGYRLIRTQLMTTGFSPGYGAYHDMIPVDTFTQKFAWHEQSVAEYSRAQIREAQQNPNYFDNAIIEMIRALGATRTKSIAMINPINEPFQAYANDIIGFTKKGLKLAPVITMKRKNNKVDKIDIYVQMRDNLYQKVNQSGLTGQLNEINTGEDSVVSLAPNSGNVRNGNRISNVTEYPALMKAIIDAQATAGRQTELSIISNSQKDQRVITKEDCP